MNDTPETDEQINGKPCTRFEVIVGNSLRDAWVPSEFARKLERERDRYKSDVEVITKERDEARGALQSVMDWNPKPEPTDRPQTVARFEADMARAREVLELEEAQETKPHQWKGRALTAERERDEALNILREINDWINVAVMRPPTPNEAADAINTWGDKIRPILEVTE